MSRQLRLARPADTALLRQVESVARLLGIRPAAVHLVPGIGSPVIWALRKPLLLWPYELPAGVSDQAVRGLIVHELAHVKRRDHWVGWLELLAGCLWWWNPLFWYVRHQLRENAELACDAWVVSAMPGGREGRRAYAEALLAVCECASNRVYRNNRTAPMPAVGVSTGGRRFLERRLAMILRDKVPLRLPRLGFLSVLLMALGSLPVWAQEAPTGAAPAPQQAAIAADEAGLQRIYTARTISPYGAVMSGSVGEALPKAAQEVLNQLRSRHEEIRREEARKLAQSRADAIAALKEIQDRFTKAGQLDEAVAVRDAVRRLQGERAIAYGPRSFWRAISVSPDPGTLISYRDKVGQTFYFDVTGTKEGTVWGTGTYTDDSALAAAAVHMGVLAPGQRGVIKVTILPGQESYTGSERNGLTTQSYNEWPGSYRIEPSDLPPGGATIYAPGMPGVGGPALGGGLGAPPPDSETPRSARDTDRWLDAASVANLQQFRDKVGQTFETDLVGSTDGRVWGSDVYTDDSSPAAAAVHAGVLRVGESGRVKITILPGQGSYEGTTRNGITTEPWQSWDGSFRIEKANGPARLERLELKEESRSSGDKPAAILRSF